MVQPRPRSFADALRPPARDPRAAHAAGQGLDWDTLTPKCTICSQPSGRLDHLDRCPDCATTIDGVQADYQRLQTEAATNAIPAPVVPKPSSPATVVGAAVEPPQVDAAEAGCPRPDDQATSAGEEPTPPAAPAEDSNPEAAEEPSDQVANRQAPPPANRCAYPDVDHTLTVLARTIYATDPVARMLRLNVLQAVEALDLYTQLRPTPVAAAAGPSGPGKPMRRSAPKAAPAATGNHPEPPTKAQIQRLLATYQAGANAVDTGHAIGIGKDRAKTILRDHGVLRPRGRAPGKKNRTTSTAPSTIPDTTSKENQR